MFKCLCLLAGLLVAGIAGLTWWHTLHAVPVEKVDVYLGYAIGTILLFFTALFCAFLNSRELLFISGAIGSIVTLGVSPLFGVHGLSTLLWGVAGFLVGMLLSKIGPNIIGSLADRSFDPG